VRRSSKICAWAVPAGLWAVNHHALSWSSYGSKLPLFSWNAAISHDISAPSVIFGIKSRAKRAAMARAVNHILCTRG
jgi:hypothetical protein